MKKIKQNTPQQLPVFYKNPVPIDIKKHQELSLNPEIGFDFAKDIGALPINLVEVPLVMKHYPIVFLGRKTPILIAVLGLKPNQNLFVKEGQWKSGYYIPAYARRYPFILSETINKEHYLLCVDHTDQTLLTNTNTPLFENERPSPLLEQALKFCQAYHHAYQETKDFCQDPLVQSLLSDFNHSTIHSLGLHNVQALDEEKLASMNDKNFLFIRKKSHLPFLYAQLFSMNNWQTLFELEQKKTF